MVAHFFVIELNSSTGCAFLCNWVKFVDTRVSYGKSPNTVVVYIKLMTNFLPIFCIISIETIRRPEGFHEISRFTEVFCFHGYWKGRLTRKIINILNINCTRDKFTPMKYCMWGNFFLKRPGFLLCNSVYNKSHISRTKY